jgi:hypothetical protein
VINSKQKGKRGELLWRNELKQAGYTSAYRSQQFCGSNSDADVICPELPQYHFEVKCVEKLNLHTAMTQAIRDCGGKIPIVAHKKNRGKFLVTMQAEDFLRLVNESKGET